MSVTVKVRGQRGVQVLTTPESVQRLAPIEERLTTEDRAAEQTARLAKQLWQLKRTHAHWRRETKRDARHAPKVGAALDALNAFTRLYPAHDHRAVYDLAAALSKVKRRAAIDTARSGE